MCDLQRVLAKTDLDKSDILYLLQLDDPIELQKLYLKADSIRRESVGNEVHLRAIIEFSSYCGRWCAYCGLRAPNKKLQRYRMSIEEIVDHAYMAFKAGYKTIVLQSGEDNFYSIDLIETIIRLIKSKMDIIITLSLGERPESEYAKMKEAGANRYLLKHETSDKNLYRRLHPDMEFDNRIKCIKTLKKLGFEVGSGIMIGLPGQSLESIASDILLFKELKIDMIGMGPFIPHLDTPLNSEYIDNGRFDPGSSLNLEEMVYKTVAVTRIVNQNANIPATTSLATINPVDGREKALCRGANVLMPNVTEPFYKQMYEIYPAKHAEELSIEEYKLLIDNKIRSIGRIPV